MKQLGIVLCIAVACGPLCASEGDKKSSVSKNSEETYSFSSNHTIIAGRLASVRPFLGDLTKALDREAFSNVLQGKTFSRSDLAKITQAYVAVYKKDIGVGVKPGQVMKLSDLGSDAPDKFAKGFAEDLIAVSEERCCVSGGVPGESSSAGAGAE